MVKVKEDMTGWKMWEHGVPDSRIVIVERVEDYIQSNGRHRDMWLCQCTCEKSTKWVVRGDHIRTGATLSCGCLKKERTITVSKKCNTYSFDGKTGIGIASNCNEKFYFDLEDYDKIKTYCWYKDTTTGYMKTRTSDNHWIHLHRFITDNQYETVDHINRNKLDNRKANLRGVTKRVNMLNRDGVISTNTSGFTGVYFHQQRCKWVAQICVDNNIKYLGLFLNKEDAIKARLKAEQKYFGNFAPQRHLFEEYGIEDGDENCNTN